ncbi:MAG: DUF1847 domain-containing protein [Thermovirga sp.]|jgi:uncharacterized metal-binding protein|nr:DUF1847 domain-containing protein [Thermovirga sp.]
MKCHLCKDKPCSKGNPCKKTDSIPLYDDPLDRKLFQVAADVEALFYKEICRVDETMEFARRMGFSRLGIAFCVGFKTEAAILGELLSNEFEVFSTCCKIGSIEKAAFELTERLWVGDYTCNPIEQARILEEEGTEFNIVLGLCVGHDSLFYKHSKAPVTTLVVKDRKLGHNPVAALYCPYIRSDLGRPLRERPLQEPDI